ncbi:MAG TPA: hypothetical protein VEY92_00105 [Pseudoxanthomonas sp.]|nr:hypothetical protein [Pseudoxanthomonas sp.]
MKTSTRSSVISAAVGLGLLATSGASLAESQYGYDPSGTGPRTAQARLTINVAVPKLILLRVGTSGGGPTSDVISLGASFTAGIPGGVSTLTPGNNQASGWNGDAPVLTSSTSASVQAWAWTNALGNGSLTFAVTTQFPTGAGITASDIAVANIPVTGAAAPLNHPGPNTGTPGTTTIPRNTVATSTWNFSAPSTVLANVASGAVSQVLTYTATTL